MSSPCSRSRRLTFFPSAPVCGVTSCMPKIFRAASLAASAPLATLTPPPLPRPPAWICAFTTTTGLPVFSITASMASSASRRENAGIPNGTCTPYFLKICFPWYSWIFMVAPLFQLEGGDQLLDRVGRLFEERLLGVVELHLDDLLHALGAQHA